MGLIKKPFSGLVKIKDYVTRRGQSVPMDLDSAVLNELGAQAIDYVQRTTGIEPKCHDIRQRENRTALYNALIEWENSNLKTSDYNVRAEERNRILRDGGNLSDVLIQKNAVCRELSIFGHLVSTFYGLKNLVVNGNLSNEYSGAHTWLLTGGRSTVVDPGYFKGCVDAASYPAETISEQELVRLR